MRVLLDTDVVIWLAADVGSVRPDTLELLGADDAHPADWVSRVAREFGAIGMSISQEHAVRVATCLITTTTRSTGCSSPRRRWKACRSSQPTGRSAATTSR